MKEIEINNRKIGINQPPYVIAEMSGNHNQSLDRALEIITIAHQSGAHAVKLQTYTPDTMTIDHRGGLFDINDRNSLWDGHNLYELYKIAHTPWEWHGPIFEHAKKIGITIFSTPFDESAVDFLENLDVPAYKIASFESNHFPLLRKIAKTGKPVIISSGTSKLNELYESIKVLKEHGSKDIVILKCTSNYPATPENTNLRSIPVFQNIFEDSIIGLSDHTLGIGVAVASIALGARVVEKHFTLDRSAGGVDSAFSLEPNELTSLVNEANRAFLALGNIQLDAIKNEDKSKRFKRSIYVIHDIKCGELYTKDNIRIIRPGDGAKPKYLELFIGKTSKRDLKRGTPLHLDFL